MQRTDRSADTYSNTAMVPWSGSPTTSSSSRNPPKSVRLHGSRVEGAPEDEKARLGRAETESNLYLNWRKIEPHSVREIVISFLGDQGWTDCEQSKQCPHLCPPSAVGQTTALAEWWHARNHRDNSKFTRMADALKRSSVGPGEVGPFVTTLVARMSEIGQIRWPSGSAKGHGSDSSGFTIWPDSTLTTCRYRRIPAARSPPTAWCVPGFPRRVQDWIFPTSGTRSLMYSAKRHGSSRSGTQSFVPLRGAPTNRLQRMTA